MSTLDTPSYSADHILPLQPPPTHQSQKLVIVGASTGGTEALRVFLEMLPASSPAVLITQHMPEMFTKSFAARLDSLCAMTVKEAVTGEAIQAGTAYIAPGHSHLMLKFDGRRYLTQLNNGPNVNRHRPSVDVMFRSAANTVGANAVGILLTGMGKDGARGLLEMKQAGAYTFAQDEASCVVFGMPKEAIALGAADEVVALDKMAERLSLHLMRFAQQSVRR